MVAPRQPATTNGGKQTPEELAVAHGIANYQRVISERDALQDRLNKMEQLITVYKIEIEGLRAEAGATVSRMESYQRERDDAVSNLAVYQTLFIALQGLLRTFGIENAPLIRTPAMTPEQIAKAREEWEKAHGQK